MKRISAPIVRNDYGPEVQNLQHGLILLLSSDHVDLSDTDLRPLSDKLASEQREGVYGEATQEAVAAFQRMHHSTFDLPLDSGERVDQATAAAMNRLLEEAGAFGRESNGDFIIIGRVEFEDGSPAAGLRVTVFDRDLGRNRVLLNDSQQQTFTNDEGVFPTIHYRPGTFEAGEGGRGPNADLVFEISSDHDERSLPVVAIYRASDLEGEPLETRVLDPVLGFESSPVEHVRIVLAGRPKEESAAEYGRLLHDLGPLLLHGATPGDFDQEQCKDVDFAARETGWERDLIETMTIAWQLARRASREPQLLAETFYGLLRHGVPTTVAPLPSDLPGLLEANLHWRVKLEDSLAHRIIDGDLPHHLARLHDLRAEADLTAGENRRGSIGDILAHAGIAVEQGREFLNAYHAHEGPIEEFWREVVPQRLGWTEAQIRDAQTTLQLADLLAYDMQLMTRLRDGGFVRPRDLAKLDRRDWISLVTQIGPTPDTPGDTLEERISRTVDSVTGLIEATYPTEVVAQMAVTSPDPKLTAARDLLSRFFEREAAIDDGFDVRTSPVTTYLEENRDRVFQGMDREDQALLKSQLQRLQRVFRLGVDRSQTEALLALGLDSAFHITRFSPEHFVAEFGEQLGGAERASTAYGRAESITGTLLYVFTDLWQGVHDVQPMAVRGVSERERLPELKELPTYRDLFGSMQLCACEHCQSFYSPAAYFVDLLHMLDRPSLGASNPVEALFKRRPDLAHIQLTCENTNTLIPYVDLVLEVMESFVANRKPLAFNVPPPPPNQKLPSPSAEELRVNPVYLTKASSTFADQAYEVLQEAVFPLTLPLNLPLETTRVYLNHLGISRAELMTLFDRDPGLEALMARAAEILLLSPEEFEIIAAAEFGGASSLRPATTAEIFGLSVANTPTANPKTLFNHAAPEFIQSTSNPDKREALIRSLQNVLNIISPTPFPVTGEFDVATEKAVNAYLLKKGLPQNGRTDDAFWGALEGDAMPSLSVMMCPVPMFLDRSGLPYEELVALVKTRFVNSTLQGQDDLDYLQRLGIPAADVRVWINAGFPAIPAAIQAKLTAAGEDPTVFTEWVQRRVRAVVLNTSFEAPCDLDRTTLMHLDGTLLTPNELVDLFYFIRLWKKLAWSLEELDLVLELGTLLSIGSLNTIFNTVLLLANVKQLREQLQVPIADLVCLWQNIPTHGDRPLYDHLFRNRAAQLLDPILELNRERTELKAAESATPPAISDHTPSILAGFRISAQDLTLIREAIGLADDPTLPPSSRPLLTRSSLSAIYRMVALARALRLRIRELIALIDLTGLAVFERPDRFPRGEALAFVEVVEKVRASGVKALELEYLCREVPQPPGLPGAQRDAWRRTLASLIDGLRAIAAEEPNEDDPIGEQFTARLTALLGADDARATTTLIYGREVYKTPLVGFPPSFAFPVTVRHKVSYDAAGKQLRFHGAMTATERAVLLTLTVPGVPAAVQLAYEAAVKALDAQPRAFVGRALKSMFTPAEAETLLIDVSSLDATGAPDAAAIDAKVAEVLARCRDALSRSLVKQTLTTATGLAAENVELLLENATVLTALGGVGSAMDDYQTLDGDGLAADYFAVPTLTGTPAVQRTDASISFDWQGTAPAPGVPAVGFSVRWQGSIYVPAAGEVTFKVQCSDGVRLKVDGTLAIDEWQDQPETIFSATLRLDGGQFYPLEVEYYNNTGGAVLELSWTSPSIQATAIPQASLYTDTRLKTLLQRVERIYKLAQFLAPFNLTAHDLRLLAERGDLTLDLLPLDGPAPLPTAQAALAQWLTLFDFAALRDRYPAAEISLIDVLNAPTPADALERFVTLTGTSLGVLESIVSGFTIPVFDPGTLVWSTDTPNLTHIVWWKRIAEALALVQRSGAAPEQLLAWARAREIRQLPTGPETLWFTWMALDADGNDRGPENRRLAQEAKDLVRARYDEEQWRTAARPLNDHLRGRRTSALTAFVLAMPEMMQARVTDSGRLFEFFLIDVEMDPCMETSRIKQGISSVQTFTQRVLLNLESPLVPPARVDHGRWQWMKTYRVWEANRKVFLYAESYTEEELRDNKTPIFKELESELLQDELNDPNAERAFRHYLEKLDQIAKLIVCGTCIDSNKRTLHVFGRTSTAPFIYYHRQLDSSRGLAWTEGIWSPWQRLPVDVPAIDDGDSSGVHMLPITWNRRLYLFWLVFERKPQEGTNETLPEGFERIECWHIKLAWSEYKDGRWSPKQTGVPFAVSLSEIEEEILSIQESKLFGPDKATRTTTEYMWFPVVGWVVVDKYSETITVPNLITYAEDPLLSGTVIKEGEWAFHEHQEKTVNVRSLLPRPADHFLDAQVSGSELTLRVFCRFKGVPKGQGRKTTKDVIAVVRDGRRADRTEQSETDHRSIGTSKKFYKQVGSFHFPACRSDLDGGTSLTPHNYESLVRPQDTTNSFMALRDDWPRVSGLRLISGAAPILKWVPNRFELIDADNRVGFDRRGPFFYQDQQRCYLVTRESFRQLLYDGLERIRPAMKVLAVQRAVGLTALTEGHIGIAAEASVRANPWAQSALVRWSYGPGLPVTPDSGAPVPMHTMSGSVAAKNLAVSHIAADLFDWTDMNPRGEYLFTPHWHPYTCPFMASLNGGGLDALFTLENQSLTDIKVITAPGGPGGLPVPIGFTINFETIYKPDPAQVAKPYPIEGVDFGRNASYSIYNWELFFHAPLLIATRLSREGQHEEALRWFHYIFFPMTADTSTGDRRVWRFLPFRTADVTRVEETLHLLTYTGTDATKVKQKAELQALIQEWIENPFRPHVLARRRPVVYMKQVFMKYLDNLIAWADELFQRDTIESINEATQLYILAANLLGPKPQRVPAPGPVAPETYQSLRSRLDALSNALVDLETQLPFTQLFAPATGTTGSLSKLPQTLYFCLPQNDRMLAYWDTIADRLFKIRHCMNIEGTVRQLPLFEPPIDPMLLVEAVAHGLDIGSVLNDLYAPLPRFRFMFTLQQALSMCAEVRSLGNTLLAVLEKRDTEKLALLRAEQETRLLDQVKLNKKLQIDEAEETRQSLEEGARIATAKIEYYDNLIAQGLISEETDQLENLDDSNERQETASWIEATAQMLNLIPNISVGTGTSVSFGGSNLGAAATAVGRSYTYLAGSYAYKANRSSITGAQTRRDVEWRFQRDLAKRELKQIERQLAAARIRREIAQADLRNHETQIAHAQSIEELLRNKFTSDSLYGWMEGTLRTVYFQCYRAAYEVAKRAERCWRYERGTEANFIKFGAWDSSMRGLLSGERLYLQLKQMEHAYLEQQVREFEITKHISLVQLDPLALIALKQSGVCEVEIPEWLFDLDYPGHYFRRLKTVSLTIPAIVGPYTSLNATLTLLNSTVRTSGRVTGAYGDEENYRPDHLAVEAIAASSAQNDSGRFELDFRDEKYLPFEGAGAISQWRIELPRRFRSFDYDTISDVVLHLKYTARRDETLSGPALAALQTELNAAGGGVLLRMFSLRHEFPSEWQAMLKAPTHTATFTIAKDRFPLLVQGGTIDVVELHYALILKEPRPAIGYKATLTPGAGAPITLDWPGQPGRYRSGAQVAALVITSLPADSAWQLQITTPVAAADLERIQDILIVARYSVVV